MTDALFVYLQHNNYLNIFLQMRLNNNMNENNVHNEPKKYIKIMLIENQQYSRSQLNTSQVK